MTKSAIDDEACQHDAQLPRAADLAELLGHLNSCRDEERRILARQLHDGLGSSLTALAMHLSLLAQRMPAERVLQERVEQMKQLLSTVVERNRSMQTSLWNDKFEFLGIKTALSELVQQFGADHAIAARASLPEEELEHPHAVGVALLRCAEEGLRNVLAHARASEVELILDDNAEAVMLTVRDNGVGPAAWDPGCTDKHGLRLLRERASYLGGKLHLAPNGERGACLTLTLPKHDG